MISRLAKQLQARIIVSDAQPGTRVTIGHHLMADEPVLAAV